MAEPPQKRFKYTSYTNQINNISVDVGKTKGLSWGKEDFDENVEDTKTPFSVELARLNLLDLTIPFQDLQKDLWSLTKTLPIILLNLPTISARFCSFYANLKDGEDNIHSGLDSVLQLHHALFETCLGEALPHLPETVNHLLRVGSLRALDPKLVERTFSTFSLIIRSMSPFLLKPTPEARQTLRSTWISVKPYLRPKQNKKYVRKCVADAWAGVIRKARGEGLHGLMDILLEDEEAGMEAVWTNSLKGTANHLHSRAMPIVNILLDRLVENSNTTQIDTLNLVLTAIVHHCSSSSLSPIIEAVIVRLRVPTPSTSASDPSIDVRSTAAMLSVLSTLLFVRKGKRFPEVLLKPTMTKLEQLSAPIFNNGHADDNECRRAWMLCVVGCLQSGKLAHWLNPGVKLINEVWSRLSTQESFAFANTLIALKWPGVEQFLLPHVAKSALSSLDTDPLDVLLLLNGLSTSGYLSGGLINVEGGRWRLSLVGRLKEMLERMTLGTVTGIEDRRIIGQALRLLPAVRGDFATFTSIIIALIDKVALSDTENAETAKRGWIDGGVWNDAHLLASLLRCVDSIITSGAEVEDPLRENLVGTGILKRVLVAYHWNSEIMESLASLIDQWSASLQLSRADLQATIPHLSSSSSSLRLSVLKILVSTSKPAVGDASTEHEIWTACLNAESSGMSLKNVRERTANIARVGRLLAAVPSDASESVKTVVLDALSYLLSQLKVNFRPLYSETITAIASLGSTLGEEVWGLVWEDLQKTTQSREASVVDLEWQEPGWAKRRPRTTDSEGEADEDIEFRCLSLQKGRNTFHAAWERTSETEFVDAADIEAQTSRDRLDVLNYEAQLLASLAAMPSVAEKHSRALVPLLLSIAKRGVTDGDSSPHFSTRQLQQRTSSFLELFSKFVNPKAFYRSDEVHELYMSILSRGEPKLQGLAIKCLMTYKSPSLLPYEQNLLALLDDAKFRDELAHFKLDGESESIDPLHRSNLLPVTIRLLYGILTSRRGRSSAQSHGSRKQAILTSLSGCTSEELGTLITLMLEPFQSDQGINTDVAGRQQLGFLTLLNDVIRYLAPQTAVHWPKFLDAVVALVDNAQRQLNKADILPELDGDGDAEPLEDEAEIEDNAISAPLRNIRSTGIKRLVQFLHAPVDFDFSPFVPSFFSAVISPRLDKLEVENTQAPSGTLELIAALAASPPLAKYLVEQDERTLPKAFACLTAVKVKPAVISRVFDIVESLLVDLDDSDRSLTSILLANIHPLLDNIIELVPTLNKSSNDDLVRRLLRILSRLAVIITDGQQAQQLASLLGPMLRQSGRKLPEQGKVNVLNTLQRLYSISPDFSNPESTFFVHNYALISHLFQTLYLPPSRRALVEVFGTFAIADPSLKQAVEIVTGINAYSSRRMEEPDFDKRLTAYAIINDSDGSEKIFSPREWLPLLRNGLFFLSEPEELSIRTNASSLIQRFIAQVDETSEGELVDMLLQVVLPGIKRTLRSKVELVRNEALLVISHAVKTCSGVPALAEMKVLLGEADDEVNFFTNVSHIQVHRRARAIRRLRDVINDSGIRENTVATIFLPVLEHIISGATDVSDHHLINEAITSTGALAGRLGWSKYYNLIMRFLRLGTLKSAQQKFYIRTVSSIIDNFHFDLQAPAETDEMTIEEGAEDEADVDHVEETKDDEVALNGDLENSARSSSERITETILSRLLPALSKLVASRDETEDNIRVPAALGIVKIAHALPGEFSANEITRIVTTVSQVLRSKDQDTRDIARDTICKIAIFLGPDWLVRVLKELQTALQRGPQKHVLAVTTHAILVQATTEAAQRFTKLDEAVEDAVSISAEVIWGESGKDVVAEGFKTKMREVRGANSRGLDTFQLIARLVTPSKLNAMLAPVRDVMHVSQEVKTMLQVDEVLRRVSLGLNANDRLRPEDILSLCFSLISGNSSYIQPKKKGPKPAEASDSFRVQMKRNAKEEEDFYPLNAHRFVAFGLDLFVTAFKRGRFAFDNIDILARLGPLVGAIGNTLYSPTGSVLMLGLKASAAIVRCPIPQVDAALPVFITNIFKVIKQAGGTAEGDVAQTALKTLAVILRDGKASNLSDTQLKYLLEMISPDIEETDRQSAIFAILRAIVARRFLVPEIYDIMDRISAVMVTNQSTHVQESCRGILMAFLLDYPQGSGRLKNQMTFLARNLSYEYEAGRISVMEVLASVFGKFSDELIAEYADMLFVALVAVLANDESEKCRTMAGVLIKLLYSRMDDRHQAKTISVLRSWVEARDQQRVLASSALSVYGLLAPTFTAPLTEEMVTVLEPVIQDSAEDLEEAEEAEETIHLDHAMPRNGLQALIKALEATPHVAPNLPWSAIISHLLFPHASVRLAAAQAVSTLFASRKEQGDAPSIVGPDGLLDAARKSCVLLKGSEVDGQYVPVDGTLADVLVKVLWNVSKHWAASYDASAKYASTQLNDEEVVGAADDGDDNDAANPATARPLPWLMSRMSFQARHLIISRPSANETMFSGTQWTLPLLAILRFFAGVFEHLAVEQAKTFLPHVLNPLHRILDESGELAGSSSGGNQPGMDELKTLALEVRDFVQAKVGVTDFSRVWENLRRKTGQKREERRQARSQMPFKDPEAWTERRGKRVQSKKDSKKRKVKAFSEGKTRDRPAKRRG